MTAKTKWLNGQLNGTGHNAPTWRGAPRILSGDHDAKSILLANIKKQQGLSPNHSFVAGKVDKANN